LPYFSAVPIYEYRCENGHTFEVVQKMSDDPVATCTTCGAPVERVFHPVAVHFKGSGFYTTDYARSKAGKDSKDGAKASSDGDSKSDSSGSGKEKEKASGKKSGSAASKD